MEAVVDEGGVGVHFGHLGIDRLALWQLEKLFNTIDSAYIAELGRGSVWKGRHWAVVAVTARLMELAVEYGWLEGCERGD